MTEPTNHRHGPPVDREVPPVPTGSPVPTEQGPDRRPRRPAGALRMVLAALVLVLLLVLIFVLQNGQRSDVYFLGAHGHLPTGVALLLAAAFGVLLVAVPAVATRLAQVRLMAVRPGGGIAAAVRKGAGS